ncbi:MAG: hypothetical protein F6K28_19405 [Microcoleus sp. SIO2G3]|nr:hypothetical protein [Microcoleus sp. SIO2G3]
MKHSEWLRLQAEGDRVVASLRADGFNCRFPAAPLVLVSLLMLSFLHLDLATSTSA